ALPDLRDLLFKPSRARNPFAAQSEYNRPVHERQAHAMSGFFADGDLTPNRIELARQRVAAGAGYIDLTSSNPTHQGLIFPADILQRAAAAYLGTRRYDPDP